MSGEQALLQRLPPSGAEILDALSIQPLMIGQGSPGLHWRGQYTGSSTQIGGQYATPVLMPGMGGAWALEGGYWYDLEFSLNLQAGAGSTTNNLVVLIQGSRDNGATWTELLALFTWGATDLEPLESATYENGNLRFYLNQGLTNIRLIAGASGNAAERVVSFGWLRIEEYTEGDEPEEFRLNASGPLIEDATNHVPAQAGSGTPGLIWRGAPSGSITLDISHAALVTGLTNLVWSLLAGYRYDIEFFATVADAAAGAQGNLILLIEGSTDNGSSWFTIRTTTISGTFLGAGEGREYFAGMMSYIPTTNITNVRCSVDGGVAGRVLTHAWIKAAQYVQ